MSVSARALPLSFSGDGETLVTVSTDGTVALWDLSPYLSSGRPFFPRSASLTGGHSREIYAVAFRPGHEQLASGAPVL